MLTSNELLINTRVLYGSGDSVAIPRELEVSARRESLCLGGGVCPGLSGLY